MRYERRKNKDGSEYFSFVYYDTDTKKQVRLTKEDVRNRFGKDIVTQEDADYCLQFLQAKHESARVRMEKRITWEKEFYNFSALLEQYAIAQKETAPNSWKNNVFYLRHYVLVYFLQEAKINNIESWRDNFDGFREWLKTAKTVKHNKRVIANQSKNHCIKALNTFLVHLEKRNIIERAFKCEPFDESLMNKRGIDDVITPDEMETVYRSLLGLGHKTEATLFRFLFFSGMRFNESIAVSVGDLLQGELENTVLAKKLQIYNMPFHGYIVADSQFGGIGPNGSVIRLPFKGTKKIEERFNRVIPITDKTLWNELVTIGGSLHGAHPNTNRRDLLIFGGIDDTTATRRLQDAFSRTKLKYRSWHCLRHSRATWLIGETGDTMLARMWLGHQSPKTIERYNHVYQAITRVARAATLTGKQFGLKKV